MNLSSYTLLITYFIVMLGYSAVFMVDGAGAPFVLASAVVAALSFFFNFYGKKAFRESLWNVLAAFVLLFFIADYLVLSGSLVVSAARFITLLLTLKLFGLKKNSDYLVVFGLVFFQFLAAASSTVSPLFFLLLTLFILSGIWAMMLFTVKKDWQDSTHKELPSVEFGWPFFTTVILISFASITVMLLLFFILPRMGQGLLARNTGNLNKTTGFSDRVDLGDIAPFKTDGTVIMRVTPEGATGGAIYLRGATFDIYDGAAWSKPEKKEKLLKKAGDGRFYLGRKTAGARQLVLDIMLEPLDSDYLVTASGAYAVSGSFTNLWYEPTSGVVRLPAQPFSAIEYRVRVDRNLVKTPPPGPGYLDTSYLDVSAEGQRIRDLAWSIVGDEKDEYRKALKIQTYLRDNFKYNLNPPSKGKAPLEDFLFRTREGFCQHYSTAMALLLRVVGVPSRVVNGYQQGEWNEYGNYFIVRQSDAHSWVEAYVDGSWLTADPTPSPLFDIMKPSRLYKLLDYWRLKWNRHVINFSLEDQRGMAESLEGRVSQLLTVLKNPRVLTRSFSGKAFLAVLLTAALLLAFRAVRHTINANKPGRTPAFYIEMTRVLKKKGLKRRPDETPLEFAARLNNPSVDIITKAYHEQRYGSTAATKAALDEVKRAIEGLRNSAP